MRNFILLAILFCMFSCSEEKVVEDVPVDIPSEEPTVESKDSVLYQLKTKDFELIAASKSKTAVFLQTDTLFAFRCLYDSCGRNRLVAYCDSLGVLERICAEGKVFDMLYHQDKSKLDIMYNNNGKIDYIRDVENPYKRVSSRAESGDVPYSAIKLQTNLSYAVYTIINTCPLELNAILYSYVQKYSLPPFESELAVEIILGMLGKEYISNIEKEFIRVSNVMVDYSDWVIKEICGEAIPIVKPYAEWPNDTTVTLKCYVNDVDSLKSKFRIGILVQESGKHWLSEGVINMNKNYNSGTIIYSFNFKKLKIGNKYEYRAYLAPLPSSKYLTGVKCLLNYYKLGQTKDFYLLETKAEVKETTATDATIELSCKHLDKHVRMGVLYGTNSSLPENECERYEIESGGWFAGEGDETTETIKIKNLKADTKYYYKPYIIYDGNIVNRELANKFDAITEKDRTFYGKIEEFTTAEDNENEELRRLLTQIYNENGGKDWEYQEKWLTDAPVAEWEGVDYIENGIYKFSFFLINSLTGTVRIENCNESILLCGNKSLRGLRLVNCPNLKIENGISQYANLKQLYIDNINIYDEVTTKNDDGSLNEKYTLKISSMSFLESIEIKNCKGKLFYLSVVNCPNLTSFICEDLVFNELFYNEETNPVVYWKTTSLNIHLCKRLNVIRCNRLSNVGEVNLENCQSLEEVSFGECNFKELNVYGNFEAKNFMVDKTNRYIDNYMIMSKVCLFDDRKNSLKFGNLLMKNVICKTNSWEGLEIDSVYFDSCVLEVGSLAIKGEPYSDVFNFNKCLKSAIFDYCHFNQNIIFDGCDKLERLSCTRSYTVALTSDYSAIDVRNTPNLKYLNCSGSDFYDILFDSHLNFVEVHCFDMRNLLKMIPDFLNPDGMVCFEHDVRYSYRKVHNQMTHEDEIEVTDRGYGWWYPDEPKCGCHERK